MRVALTLTGYRLTVANANCQLSAQRLLFGTSDVMTPTLNRLLETVNVEDTDTDTKADRPLVLSKSGSLMLLSDKKPTKATLPAKANRSADITTSRVVIG